MYSPRDVFLSRTATGVCVGSLAAVSCAVIIRIAWISRTGIPRALTASAVIVLVSLIGCALSYSIRFAIRDKRRRHERRGRHGKDARHRIVPRTATRHPADMNRRQPPRRSPLVSTPLPDAIPPATDAEDRDFSYRILVVFTLVAVAIALFREGDNPVHGPDRISWLAIVYAVAFLIMLACIGAITWAFDRFARAERAGKVMGFHARLAYLALPVIILIPSTFNTLAYGTPVALDLATGPQTVTVASCTHKERTESRSRGRYAAGSYTVIIHRFTMTLTDGTTHQTNVRDEYFRDRSTINRVLDDACIKNPGTTSATMSVYYYSWVINDAHLN